jgi:AraC-like DNA-binding protein
LLRQTGYPLKHIANAVGFKNESHFCQKFRKFVSMTPNEFRYLS